MEPTLLFELAKWLVPALLGLAAAWGALRMKIATQNEEIKRLRIDRIEAEKELDERIENLSHELQEHRVESADRLARMETKLDTVIAKLSTL